VTFLCPSPQLARLGTAPVGRNEPLSLTLSPLRGAREPQACMGAVPRCARFPAPNEVTARQSLALPSPLRGARESGNRCERSAALTGLDKRTRFSQGDARRLALPWAVIFRPFGAANMCEARVGNGRRSGLDGPRQRGNNRGLARWNNIGMARMCAGCMCVGCMFAGCMFAGCALPGNRREMQPLSGLIFSNAATQGRPL